MAKFHIDKNGAQGECKAHLKPCPYGGPNGDELHFETAEEAQEYADEYNKLLSTVIVDNIEKEEYSFAPFEEFSFSIDKSRRNELISRVYRDLGFNDEHINPVGENDVLYFQRVDSDDKYAFETAAEDYLDRAYDSVSSREYLEDYRPALYDTILEEYDREVSSITGWNYRTEDIIESSSTLDDDEVIDSVIEFNEWSDYDSTKLKLEDFESCVNYSDGANSVDYKSSDGRSFKVFLIQDI